MARIQHSWFRCPILWSLGQSFHQVLAPKSDQNTEEKIHYRHKNMLLRFVSNIIKFLNFHDGKSCLQIYNIKTKTNILICYTVVFLDEFSRHSNPQRRIDSTKFRSHKFRKIITPYLKSSGLFWYVWYRNLYRTAPDPFPDGTPLHGHYENHNCDSTKHVKSCCVWWL